MTTDTPSSWARLDRVIGWAGIAAVPLLFTPTIAISTLGEPPFDGSAREITTFYDAAAAAPWHTAGEALQAIATLVLLWWAAALTRLLRHAEGDPAWRSTAALASAVVFAAYVVISPYWAAAAYRGAPRDDVAVFAFDLGNLGFANSWLALASFAAACGWVTVETRVLPLWTGWLALAGAVGFVVARFVWTTNIWFLPYAMFWVWVVAVSVAVLRRRGASEVAAAKVPATPRV